MADLSTAVDTDGTGNYTSLSAAEDANDQDLTDGGGDTFTFISEASSGTADTTGTIFFGWTTAAANYVQIAAKAGEEAIKTGWDPARYRLSVTDATALDMRTEFWRLVGVQVEYIWTDTAAACVIMQSISGDTAALIDRCRIRQSGAGSNVGNGVQVGDTEFNLDIFSTIIEGAFNRNLSSAGETLRIYNSIFYGPGSYGMRIISTTGTTTIKNCAIFNNTDDIFDQTAAATIDFNASDDNDGTNNVGESGGGATWPDDFVDAANGDFTLKTGSNLKVGGTTSIAGTDMDGDAWEDPASVGIDEFAAAPAGIASRIISRNDVHSKVAA